jgi:formylglycine-generating enzyme required for sulfatase activity
VSAIITAPPPPPPSARNDLIAALGELRYQVNDIRKSLRDVNDEDFRPKIEQAIDVTGRLLSVYLPEPNHDVLQALRSVYFAAQNIRVPVKDAILEERTETLDKLRAGLGRLRYALDEAWKSANIAYAGGDNSLWERGNNRIVPAEQIEDFKAKVDAVLERLDALQAAVNKVGRERNTAPRFVQQGQLVTFYTETMTVEIDVARLHLTVNETCLDVGALVDTIEQMRDTTEDFRVTVQGWVDDVTNEVLTGVETLNDGVRRLVTGVRALGGMIGAGDSDAPDMVLIPRGTFMMGLPEEVTRRVVIETSDWEVWPWYAQPLHEVTIRRPFLIGRYPVTVGEYAVFAKETNRRLYNPDFPQTDRHPVVNVTFTDAIAFVEWLSQRTGDIYRLPSEAEWEYACRAGTTTARYWGDEFDPGKANVNHKGTTEVGAFPPNPWGLYDTLGNVFEWVSDRWHDDYEGAPADGSAWIVGRASSHVLRGGCWSFRGGFCGPGFRTRGGTRDRRDIAGFRLARSL